MKKRILWLGLGLLGLISLLPVVGFLWWRVQVGRNLPRLDGTVTVPGLAAAVDIIRDEFGVPHIFAESEPDLFLSLGFVMAQDRLWQMDFHRRLGAGRLAELFGEELVETDLYFRTLTAGMGRPAIPPDSRRLLEAFAAGVNAYIESHRNRMPVEFEILKVYPEPWSVEDYFPILKLVCWGLSSGWRVDPTAGGVLEKVGEEMMRQVYPAWPGEAPVTVPSSAIVSSGLRLHGLESAVRWSGFHASGASNNWVIGPSRSKSGRPILANDTHLPLINPSFWYEVRLVCPTMDVSGFAIPGIPGIPVGQNRKVAWGVTNVMLDDVDFFAEKRNPDNPKQVLYRDRWVDLRVHRERIRVRGGGVVDKEVFVSPHGPLITGGETEKRDLPLAARWAFRDRIQTLRSALLLMKSENVFQAIDALRDWAAPAQNFVFADVQGNFGYWCCGTVPVRVKGDGLLPVPGWDGEYEWSGFVPFEELPHVVNPESGFVASANNKVGEDGSGAWLGRYWEPSDRIVRIRRMIGSRRKLGVEDVKAMQLDVTCPLAEELTPRLVRVLKERLPRYVWARTLFENWDHAVEADSTAAALFETVFGRLVFNLLHDELGDELFSAYLKASAFVPRAMRHLTRLEESAWFDRVDTPRRETLDDILEISLLEAIRELERKSGGHPEEWTWGRLHQIVFVHPFGLKKPLDALFNLGPYAAPGNHLTVDKNQYSYGNPFRTEVGVSQRMIVDLAAPDRSYRVLPTGESGNPDGAHYEDQTHLYLSGTYRRCCPESPAASKSSKERLTLKPE